MIPGKITHLLKDGRGFIESENGMQFGFHQDDRKRSMNYVA